MEGKVLMRLKKNKIKLKNKIWEKENKYNNKGHKNNASLILPFLLQNKDKLTKMI